MKGCVVMLKQDKHIHTPFCPHGSQDALQDYVEKAIKSGFTEISFTEHAPLPPGFVDPTPEQDSGMKLELLEDYFHAISTIKHQYQNDITILCGLEVDFIEGFEQQTKDFLTTYGSQLDDAILSVHFLRHKNTYTCLDFSAEVFSQFALEVGSYQAVYDLYYATVEKSILADLGPYRPKRIGHPTLVHKFQLSFEETIDDTKQIEHILRLMKTHEWELDVNSAGLSKPDCLEPYPPYEMITFAKSLGVPLVFGSDAHTVKGLHQNFERIKERL